ncbi:MAG: hypothetical protein F4089_13415 [Gammaproteobacteria bacterium]|nr:hypothetical protein [Gammaproteobacteria bacterium]MYJ76020.1 hypothetical protein [Gammaproteobacteria bacterium]
MATDPAFEISQVTDMRWETEFQNVLIEFIIKRGHGVWLLDPARLKGGGIPDLLVVTKDGRALFRELKTDVGHVDARQEEIIKKMRSHGADVDVWRPRDFSGGSIGGELD